jgi:hypothetical protein
MVMPRVLATSRHWIVLQLFLSGSGCGEAALLRTMPAALPSSLQLHPQVLYYEFNVSARFFLQQAESEKDAISSLRPPFTLAVNEAVAPWTFIRSSKRLNTLHTHR